MRKRSKSLTKINYQRINARIKELHFCQCSATFNLLFRKFIHEFSQDIASNNFTKHWIESNFNNWQIYKTPPG